MNIIDLLELGVIALLATQAISFLVLSFAHHKKQPANTKTILYKPLLSIIVPAYNEGPTLKNCIDGLAKQTYRDFEVLIINDGSTDSTEKAAKSLAKKYKKVKYYRKQNGGKASALNHGIKKSNGSIIVSLDADSILHENTLTEVVRSFENPKLDALGGNVKVSNRENILSLIQTLEYITGLHLQRRTFAYLGCPQVIPGPIGAFRKTTLEKVGLYSDDTKVEDMDITIAIATSGGKIEFNPRAIAYTESPVDLKNFYTQRLRWTQGTFKVLEKYKSAMFNKNKGTMGLIGLPYVLIFTLLELALSAFILAKTVEVLFTQNFEAYAINLATTLIAQFLLSLYALYLDKEDMRLALLAPIKIVFYSHLLAAVTAISLYKYLFGKDERWDKIPRMGKNQIIRQKVARKGLAF